LEAIVTATDPKTTSLTRPAPREPTTVSTAVADASRSAVTASAMFQPGVDGKTRVSSTDLHRDVLQQLRPADLTGG